MNKSIKYALLFTGGAVVGFGVCAVKMIDYALNDEDIREGIKNKIANGVDKAIFGEERPRYRSKVSYSNYYDRYSTRRRELRQLADEVIFETRKTAEKVLGEMKDIHEKYGVVTVADFFELAGIDPVYTDNAWGWIDLSDAKVIRVRAGYHIDLPEPKML